nr:hypothetical protein [Tanacetum cinerariifolium]
MTIETHNWSSSAHQELHKIVRDENFPIVNQVDARLQIFEIQFLKEEAKFVGDFKSLANEAHASLAKHRALELEIERLLKADVSQDIMIIVQKESAIDTSDLQTELEHTKEKFENSYKDMQQKIERLQAQLGDLKSKKFQVLNYARENAHLKATYKNMFDSIYVSRTQTKSIIASFQNELQSTIYKNAKLRTQLFKKVSDQKDNTQDTSKNTKFAKQPIVENLSKVGETNALSKPVTSNSVSTPQESKDVNNDKVIAPGMFRINHFKTSREEKHVPNTVSASARTKPITVSQPPVITKKDVNSDVNGLSSTGVDNTKTRRPQPRSNTKHDRVPSASKSSRSKNKEAEIEDHHRNLLLSKNNKHISSACNNIKIDTHDVISKVVCAMCKKCLISVNHDKCLHNYVNGKNSSGKKQKAKVSVKEIQMKYQPKVTKPKKVETRESLAIPKPRKSRLLLRWSPTGKLFDQEGKIVDSSESKSQYDCFNGDNACTSNYLEPKIKWFPNSTSLLDSVLSAQVKLSCRRYRCRFYLCQLPLSQEEQYTELLEPILELHQVPQNDNDAVSEVTGVVQGQNAGNLNGYNVGNQVAQNLRVQNIGNQNGLIGVQGNGNQNQIGNGNLVAVRAEGNAAGHNGNQIRCYNCRGLGHFARDCTVMPRRRDDAYLQTQLLIAQKEEAGIQLQAEEYDLMAAAADLDKIEEVNANCILMANLQQASSSEEQYTELLEPIPESQQVPQNDNNVISEVTNVKQDGETVDQHSANFEETRALYESLYQKLAVEVEKVNSVNRKLKET